ncbi:unnamed protein product [Amaranthus hypochondriacus]
MVSSTNIFSKKFPRRILLQHSSTLYYHPTPSPPPLDYQLYTATKNETTFDSNVVMILSVLLCLLVFSICINCLIRCMFKCLIWITTQQEANHVLNNNNNKVVMSGVDKRALNTFPKAKYSKKVKIQGLCNECVICLCEFKEGERVRLLPKCNHGFHVKCIDVWLSSHSSCPTCRHSLLDTCQKIIGFDGDHDHQASPSPSPSPSSNELIGISIEPLEREDFVRN